MVVEITWGEVWREISNYLEGEISGEMRTRMEENFRACKHCTAAHDGTHNVVQLVGDATAFEVPAGFSDRLYENQLAIRNLCAARNVDKASRRYFDVSNPVIASLWMINP